MERFYFMGVTSVNWKCFSYFYFSSDVITFEDSNEFKELLMITTPLKEHFLCAMVEKDTARHKDMIDNNGQFLGTFNELFVTIELELVKQVNKSCKTSQTAKQN